MFFKVFLRILQLLIQGFDFEQETVSFMGVGGGVEAISLADKYRLLRGILDGPIVVGRSTLIPHVGRDPEDEMMKILEGIKMTIRHNHIGAGEKGSHFDRPESRPSVSGLN